MFLILGVNIVLTASKILSLLPKHANYYFTKADIPRALAEEDLKLKAADYELMGLPFKNVNTAIKSALNKAKTDDLILVCGSIFLIAEVDASQF